jgi:taurine dioxygenase
VGRPIAVRPLTPVIGAEIAGMDLNDLDDDDFRAIHEAFLAHGVVFFRGQDISIETHRSLSDSHDPRLILAFR